VITKKNINKLLKGFQPRESMNDILPLKPGWYSRWVFPVFAGIVALILTLLWNIPHPDIVIARGILTGMEPGGRLHAEVNIAENDLRRIDSGKSILLRFNEYPVREFGFVAGSLTAVSPHKGSDNMATDILLSQGLTTTKNKLIVYKEGLKIDLLITVKNMRLLQRIFNKSARVVVQ
jgi:hypothetical protein